MAPAPVSAADGTPAGGPREGSVLWGYRLERELARGAQGAVFRAVRPGQAARAIKVFVLGDPRELARARHEAEVLGGLRHPNLPQLFEHGELPGGTYATVMELIDGESLQGVLERGPPRVRWTAEVLVGVAEALHYCHQNGVVHRDVKPANVVIEEETGRAVLLDFGVLRRDPGRYRLGNTLDQVRFSQTGELVGTPASMAPEQATGGAITPATDVYGLGATLYMLLTGEAPFRGSSLSDLLVAVVESPPPDPRRVAPGIPRQLADLCRVCLAKDPQSRPADALVFAEALRAWRARPVPSQRRPGWRRLLLPAGSLLAAALMTLGWLVANAETVPPSQVPAGPSAPPGPASPESSSTLLPQPSPSPGARPTTRTDPRPKSPIAREAERERLLSDAKRALRQKDVPSAKALITSYFELPGTPDAEAVAVRGIVRLRAGGDLAAAEADIDAALAARPRQASLYHAKAEVLDRSGRKEQALAAAERARELRPRDPLYTYACANLLASLRRHEAALGVFAEALQLDPDYEDALTGRALLLSHLGRFDEARQGLEQALTRRPRSGGLHYMRSVVLQRSGRLAEAVEAARLATELAPRRAEGWQQLAVTLGDARRPREALAAARRAVEVAPNDPLSQISLATALCNVGREDEALALIERTLRECGELEQARFMRGQILFHRQDPAWRADMEWVAERASDPRIRAVAGRFVAGQEGPR